MMDEFFWEGFEKEAKLKAALMAGLIAATPIAAKAGGSGKALSHATQAASKQWGHVLKKNAPKAVQNVQKKVSQGVSGSGGKLSLKDLSRIQYKKGKFQASVGGGGDIKAKYNLNKNFNVEGKRRGNNTYAGFNYKRDF